MTVDILPSSLARETKDAKGSWIPYFCANCGKAGGRCLDSSTFLFWLCNLCFDKHGAITGTMAVPDQEFYDKMKHEQQESFGHYLSPQELAKVHQLLALPFLRP